MVVFIAVLCQLYQTEIFRHEFYTAIMCVVVKTKRAAEKLKDIKEIIRRRKSKDNQYNE